MQVARNRVVTIAYSVADEQGTVLDSSEGSDPLAYIHGTGSLVPGLERVLEGRAAPDRITVTVLPADGYGEKDAALVAELPRDNFASVGEVSVGMQLEMSDGDDSRIVTVTGMDDTTVTVDGNHPLAGMTLLFDVTIIDVRNATEEELEHGHAHGEGHHHHH
jgi:FKBP-type peptidyl-prolyl cis-trans isomerase SlyD